MTGDLRVVEDGVDQQSSGRPPGGPSWLWLGVGLAIGVGLAAVFSLANTTTSEQEEAVATVPEVDQPEDVMSATPTTVAPDRDGVGEVVEGFPDTLVAVTQLDAGNLGYLTWPVSGPPLTSALPGFATAEVEFDPTGRMVAMSSPVADSAGDILSVGMSPRIQPLVSGVSGFAWHDSEFGELAFTQVIDSQAQLSVVDRFRDIRVVAAGLPVDAVVVAFGSWGFALQGDQNVTILDESGQPVSLREGRVLDSAADGRLVIYDGSLSLVEESGSTFVLTADVGLVGEIEAAAISPDGSKLAVVGVAGHMIVPLDGSGESTYAQLTSGISQIAWSSDSRFLVSPWIRGVLFIDTLGATEPVAELTRYTVVAVTAIPLGGG